MPLEAGIGAVPEYEAKAAADTSPTIRARVGAFN
jgi:hypothetical protein